MGVSRAFFVAILSVIVISSKHCQAQKEQDDFQLDPVDLCIMACDQCYEDHLLLKCANDCIKWNADVPVFWKRTCPHFFSYPKVEQM